MDLNYVLIIYIILLIFLTFGFCKYGLRLFSAFILSVIICWIVLNILMPPNEINEEETTASLYSLYFLIQFLSFILILIYTIIATSTDFKSNYLTIKVHSKYIDKDKKYVVLGKSAGGGVSLYLAYLYSFLYCNI